MSYLDNPRKIVGKVEIVYSDTEISNITGLDESSNATVSHPHEVYHSNLSPTVKACTMDGNSIMDGTFQMMDDSCILGWWSNNLADENGEFLVDTFLEISFVTRPIVSWMIIGDTKLNQYPVDFIIEYKRNGVIVKSEEFTNNSEVQKKIYTTLSDITSIKITITKWNTPYACVKILKFFDMLAETYIGNELKDFEVNEEMASVDTTYNINSDTMSVTIYNKDQKFNIGYLKNLLILDRKVKPFIGIEENGVVNYIPLGVFYSSEWKVDQDGQWVKCLAVDRLMRLQSKIYVGYQLNYNVTLYSITEDILTKAGFTEANYLISENLRTMVIPSAFLPKCSVWDALQEIANTGLCKVYIDRDDRINVRCETDTPIVSGIEINASNMFSYQSNISLTEFANRVAVEYADVELSGEVVEAATTLIAIDANTQLEITLDFTTDIAYASVYVDNPNLIPSEFSAGINACIVKITNNTKTSQTGKVVVEENAIDITYKTITVEDEASVRDYGSFEYKHPSCELIQSSTQAQQIATILLNKMKAGEGVVTCVWRGTPNLDLANSYRCKDRYGDLNEFICEYNKLTFDGGLKQTTRGRKKT